MNAAERHELIMESIAASAKVSVSELAARTAVSEMTIRRDLEALEHRGVLTRVHGGAVSAVSRSYEPPFAMREVRNHAAKQRIGRLAASLLREGDTAVLDAGSTTMEIARALAGRRNLRIMALSLRIAEVLVEEPSLTVMVAGGVARPGEHSLIGSLAERTFEALRFDTFFLSVGGISRDGGCTEYNDDDAAVKRAAFSSARRRIAVADASKLGHTVFSRICALEELDVLVTDESASPELLEHVRQAGVEVLVA